MAGSTLHEGSVNDAGSFHKCKLVDEDNFSDWSGLGNCWTWPAAELK